ncbi:uncharacterized protein LOC110845249 [Folsomia candida]|uniref:Uncharacterized protein n=1 Tax=Folsomia candida TaxID=158441 RepID=A0A226ERZ6_FOLCA|nr:uncharacterized protein LOC110845249 [Folsomia candida]OXA59988.1 hypothetical protein Fcan01_04190 [Folsomia candida]
MALPYDSFKHEVKEIIIMAILLTAVDFIGMKEEYTEIVKFVMLAYYIVEWAFIMFMRYYYQNPFPLWMEIQTSLLTDCSLMISAFAVLQILTAATNNFASNNKATKFSEENLNQIALIVFHFCTNMLKNVFSSSAMRCKTNFLLAMFWG